MGEQTREEALEQALHSFLHWHQQSIYDSREGRGSDGEDSALSRIAKEAQAVLDRDHDEFAPPGSGDA